MEASDFEWPGEDRRTRANVTAVELTAGCEAGGAVEVVGVAEHVQRQDVKRVRENAEMGEGQGGFTKAAANAWAQPKGTREIKTFWKKSKPNARKLHGIKANRRKSHGFALGNKGQNF